jgi:hypothetical protein
MSLRIFCRRLLPTADCPQDHCEQDDNADKDGGCEHERFLDLEV